MADTTTRASLGAMGEQERGLLDELKEGFNDALDVLTGVKQDDVAAGRVDLTKLAREDRIELLVDGETSSIFGSSPWGIGRTMGQDVSDFIHENKGATLVFQITAGALDAAQSKVRAVRYALVWDDNSVSEHAVLDVSAFGSTFLVVGVKDEPLGKTLTFWVTDDDLTITLVKQGTKQQLEAIRKEVIGEIGAAAEKDDNPITDAFNKVTGFITTTQIGGVVALAVIGVLLVVIVKSQAVTNLAKNTKATIGGIV